MDTKSIIKSLELATCQGEPVPSQLIKLVEEALEERDGLMVENKRLRDKLTKETTDRLEAHRLARKYGGEVVVRGTQLDKALEERDEVAVVNVWMQVENEKLRAALSAIAVANAACDDMTQPLEDAARLMGG